MSKAIIALRFYSLLFVILMLAIRSAYSGPKEDLQGFLRGFSDKPLIQYSAEYLPRETRIQDLASADGHLFLFRTITACRYKKDFVPTAFPDSHHGYSYSLYPSMPLRWSYFGDVDQDLILIAYQSIESDFLTYPDKNPTKKSSADPQPKLTINTRLEEIAFYDEIKVPLKSENVIGVMRKNDFAELVDQYKNHPYTIADIINDIANHPRLFPADAKNPRGCISLRVCPLCCEGCSIQ